MGIVCCNRVDVETEIWQEEESMRKKKMRKEQAAGVSLSARQGLYGSTDNNIITNASFFFSAFISSGRYASVKRRIRN